MKRTLTVLAALVLVAAVIVLVAAYAFLPPFIEGVAARGVQDRLGLEETPEVRLEGDPLPMLAGRFSGGEISLGDADLGGVRAEQVVVDLDPFDLDVVRSLTAGAPVAEEPLSGTLRATLPEAEVLRVVRAGADVPVRDLRLEDGRMIVDSEAMFLGLTVPVSVQGDLLLRGESLVFEPQRVAALGSDVPGEIAQGALEGTDLSFPLEGLPDGAVIEGVEVEENRLVLDGVIERIPLDPG